MKMRALSTLLLGIGLASVSVYFVHERLNQNSDTVVVAAEPQMAVGTLIVATADLAYGHRLRREHLSESSWPVDAMPQGSFETVEDLLGDGDEPRVVLRAMTKGEPVLASKVSGFGARATLSSKVQDGKRAFSIRVNDVSGVAGFLLPGDRVDVLLTRALNNDRNQLVTDVILQNVEVLGIDQLSDDQQEKPQVARTATVEVEPRQSQKLALAMQVGTLSLALRNVATAENTKVRPVRVSDLVGSPPPKPGRPVVRVRRGATVSVERVVF